MKRLVIICTLLFCVMFILAIPMKMANNKFADLLQQEDALKDSIYVLEYELAMELRAVDSLSSRKRIEEAAEPMDLGMYVPATKIKGGIK